MKNLIKKMLGSSEYNEDNWVLWGWEQFLFSQWALYRWWAFSTGCSRDFIEWERSSWNYEANFFSSELYSQTSNSP